MRVFLLLLATDQVDDVLASLAQAEVVDLKAKDILCAAKLKLLDDANINVFRVLKKIQKGKHISPIPFIRVISS